MAYISSFPIKKVLFPEENKKYIPPRTDVERVKARKANRRANREEGKRRRDTITWTPKAKNARSACQR